MKRSALSTCVAAFFFASVSISQAQVTTYFGDANGSPRDLTVANASRNLFLSQLGINGTDNFDSYPVFPSPPPPTYTLAGVGTTYTSNGTLIGFDGGFGGNLSTSPTQFLLANAVSPSGPFGPTNDFIFSNKIQAFGIYFIQAGDGSNSNSFTVTLKDGPAGTPRTVNIDGVPVGNGSGPALVFSGRQFDNAFFFGITDNVFFDRVTITNTSSQDGVIFDDLTIGFTTAVPEPATYALIGGILALGYGRNRYLKRIAAKNKGY